jgi:hypothetical protein
VALSDVWYGDGMAPFGIVELCVGNVQHGKATVGRGIELRCLALSRYSNGKLSIVAAMDGDVLQSQISQRLHYAW